jgi:sigma-B regulation protein RsbU (phosphoserine phosphatase)
MIRIGDLYDIFSTISTQKLFLLNKYGVVLLGPQDSLGYEMKTIIPLKFIENRESVAINGVEAAKDNTGNDFVISYSQIGFGGLTVVSAVLKSKALSALDILLKKSIIFFVLLIAVTAIISLFASSSITTAITQLFQATQKVSDCAASSAT